jgi:hypothetical protein
MAILSHLHQLFDVKTCYAYIHHLRFKERPLQCPRCQSHDVDPWGDYHYLWSAKIESPYRERVSSPLFTWLYESHRAGHPPSKSPQ